MHVAMPLGQRQIGGLSAFIFEKGQGCFFTTDGDSASALAASRSNARPAKAAPALSKSKGGNYRKHDNDVIASRKDFVRFDG